MTDGCEGLGDMWLRENFADIQRKLKRAEHRYESLKNKDSHYGQAHARLIAAHRQALAIYRDAQQHDGVHK